MRAMILTNCGPIEKNPLKLSQINKHGIKKDNEILVRIEACGVCHSQLHGIEGDWLDIGIPPELPTIPGHEIAGKVVEIGVNVKKFKIGDKVGITPLLESCRNCQYCKEGTQHLCESSRITGESLMGGYTEYIVVAEDFATKIPNSMKPEYAAPLFCAGITGYKAVKAAEPQKNQKIGIFGIGGVGHLAIQFAKIEGAHVIAISRNKNHLEVAKKLGATDTIVFNDDPEFLNELKKKQGLLDAAIVFAPTNVVRDFAIKSVKRGGLIVIATVGNNPPFFAFEEKTIRGTVIGSPRDMEEVIKICEKNNIQVITETYPLEEANMVLQKLKNSLIQARAVLMP